MKRVAKPALAAFIFHFNLRRFNLRGGTIEKLLSKVKKASGCEIYEDLHTGGTAYFMCMFVSTLVVSRAGPDSH